MGIENDTAIARQLFATFHIRYIIVEIVHDMIFSHHTFTAPLINKLSCEYCSFFNKDLTGDQWLKSLSRVPMDPH